GAGIRKNAGLICRKTAGLCSLSMDWRFAFSLSGELSDIYSFLFRHFTVCLKGCSCISSGLPLCAEEWSCIFSFMNLFMEYLLSITADGKLSTVLRCCMPMPEARLILINTSILLLLLRL